jgi:hypothetical protein
MESWRLTFSSRVDLERIVRGVGDINTTITVVIKQKGVNGDFDGILVEDMHVAQTCLIRAKLECHVQVHEQNAEPLCFTCNCKALTQVLKATKSQYRLDIVKRPKQDLITLESFDSMQCNYRSRTSLTTVVADTTEFQELREMQFQYSLRIESPFFKSMLKNNKDLQAQKLRIELLRSDDAADGTLVRLSCHSDISEDVKEFISDNIHADAAIVDDMQVNHADHVPPQPWDERFCTSLFAESYDIDCILNFIKSVDAKPVLLLKLGGQTPLLMESPLCSPDSSVFLLVSAFVEGD